ncbi:MULTISPECIES: hypothetical protein, partial [unclassified Limnobacter]|uniref:hypothetical protein n=1 Tax=unclassified Limnobacter TaxID=2630203 RepID=UPI0025C22DFB
IELGEQESIQKGITRFSVRNKEPMPSWLETATVTIQVLLSIHQFSATQVTRAKVTREDRPTLLAVQ